MEWKTVKLGDILKITGGQLYKGDLLGTGDNLLLGMGCVSFLEKFLMKGARQYGGDCLDKNIGRPGDIVLATRQQSDNLPILAMPAIIPEGLPAKKIIIGSNLYKVNVTDPDFNSRFIYWLLKTPEYVNYISSVKTGTTVKMITIKDVESYTFLCPPKESRDKISKFLWDLDDKIENNNRINANLEAQAKALFKSWFIDFEPFGGSVPNDWKEGTLEDICTQLKEKVGNRDDVKVLSPVTTGKLMLSEEYFIKQVFSQSIEKYIVVPPTAFAYNPARVNIGSLGMNEFDFDGCVSPVYVVFECKEGYEYFFDLFRRTNQFKEEVKSRAIGGVRQTLGYDDFKRIQTVIPPKEIVDEFNKIYTAMLDVSDANKRENQRLAALRDSLLPKLMRGEIAL